ncbi:MAG: lipopolysaccharide heptosyltransferase II [Planctomycetota bacterium]|nr:MAG: lipopolysaccharide heptosyltransferase II [Planctomycetota bacterium]
MAGGTLIVDTSFLGDVLCAEPMVRAAAKRWQGQPVDFLASPGGAHILSGHPDLGDILVFDKRGAQRGALGLLRMARELKKRAYVRAICSHRSWRSAALLRLAGIPERVGFDNASASFLFTERVSYQADLHEIERNLQLLGGGSWQRPRMYPDAGERERVAGLLPGRSFVAMAPGSLWETKRWPAQRFSELAAALSAKGVDVVLLGGPEDRPLCREVHQRAKDFGAEESALHDLCGQTNLRESAALLEKALALVSNDSAPMHLGVAAGIPVMAVYCSTVPAFGFAPKGEQDRVFEISELDCRPCGIHGKRRCPEGHFRCGWDIQFEQVLQALQPFLPQTSLPV